VGQDELASRSESEGVAPEASDGWEEVGRLSNHVAVLQEELAGVSGDKRRAGVYEIKIVRRAVLPRCLVFVASCTRTSSSCLARLPYPGLTV
jgi:hypothetical protein